MRATKRAHCALRWLQDSAANAALEKSIASMPDLSQHLALSL